MKSMRCLLILVLSVTLAACQSGVTNKPANEGTAQNKTENNVPVGEPKVSEAKPPVFSTSAAPDNNPAVQFPFADFPKVEVAANAGDYVLAPSYNWIKDAAEKGADSTTFIWYVQKMSQPDRENSELQFLQERHKVPNAYLIPIPPRQTAKKGDIVLTWWQTGSGMQRAIVVDDADPARPVVRYLDIAYDNPAKSRDGSTTIGRMDERLVPDSFVKLSFWGPGTTVTVQDGASQKSAKVIRVAGNKVLVIDGAGKLKVYSKTSCQPVPLVPNVRAGDQVKAPRYGQNFAAATVTNVDTRNGRVFVRFEGESADKAVAFGDVMKN